VRGVVRGLPPQARMHWFLVVGTGCLTILLAAAAVWAHHSSFSPAELASTAILLVLAVAGESLAIQLISYERDPAAHSVGSAAAVAAIIVLPWYLAIPVVAVGMAASQLRNPGVKLAFNVSYISIQTAVAALAFNLAGGRSAVMSSGLVATPRALGILVLLALTYYVSGTFLVARLFAILSGDGLRTTLRATHLKTSLQEATTIGLGLMLGGFWLYNPAFVPFVVLPVVMAYFSIDTFVRIQEETRQAVLAMSESIDHRDPLTYNHSKRVAKLSVALAEEVALSHEQVATIELSALVHDIGKIGISSDVLMKPGKLTPEERAQMELHPVIGFDMLRHYKQFRKGLGIVRWHHETWEGNGYPDKLGGTDIPIEARIVSICDAYEAMTADRPYRKAMSAAVAMSRLEAASGTQFDPELVPAFRRAAERIGERVTDPIPLEQSPMTTRAKRVPAAVIYGRSMSAGRSMASPSSARPRRRQSSSGRCRPSAAIIDAGS